MKKKLSSGARRRRNELIIIAIISVLIVILTTIEMKIPSVVGGTIPFSYNIIVFSLININIILILLLIFLVIRNLVKLIFERKRRVLGARLRTRLVVTFIILSLVPTILLFLVAVGFITSSVEHWFKAQVEQSLQGSLEVAQSYHRDFSTRMVSSAQQISKYFSRQGLSRAGGDGSLKAQIEAKRQEYQLGTLQVFFKGEASPVKAQDPALKGIMLIPPTDLLEEGFSGKSVSRIVSVGEGEMITGVAPLFNPAGGSEVIGAVTAAHFMPASLSAKMREIAQAFVEYKQLKLLKNPIKSSYKVALLMVTLLIVFAATWFGFHLAKDITVPIKELAEATHRIASGDLNFRIQMKAADEIGMLVQSFNQMTEDVQTSRLELEQRKKYMEIVLKNVAAGVISIDEKETITTINTSAEEMLGTRGEAVLEKRFSEALAPEYVQRIEELREEMKSARKDSIARQVTVNLKGKAQTLLINLSTLKDEEGRSLGVVAVFDDLTQLIKAQRMAAWREVARRIAHEIKNPLTPIQLSAQRLRKRYLSILERDGTVLDECTNTIVKQVEELKKMVNEFSNFARLPASEPAPHHLNEIIREALVLFEAHKDVHFEFTPRELPVFNVDRDQIKRVMINLIKNSLAAFDKDGEIKIQTNYDPVLQVVRLEVSDNGCGIPDEDKGRLFEPYFSRRKAGTGLGLTIVNAIVADHNGYIRVRDNQPRGTTFLIELPIRV